MPQTPWRVSYKSGQLWVVDQHGDHIAEINRYAASSGDKQDRTNGYDIVRAVNSHAALVAALQRVKVLMESGDLPGKDWMEYGQITQALARAKEGHP